MSSILSNRSETSAAGRPVRRIQTWNDGGIQYTQQETSCKGANLASFMFSRTGGLPSADRDSPQAFGGRRKSVLGTVINGMADLLTSNAQLSTANNGHARQERLSGMNASRGGKGHNVRINSGRPNTLFFKVTASFTEPQSSEKQGSHCSRDPDVPMPPPRPFARRRTDSAPPAFVEEYARSDESDISEVSDADSEADYEDIIEALENKIEQHRREAKLAREHFEQASRQGQGIGSYHSQNLARKIEYHDNARRNARRDLKQIYVDAEEEKMSQERRRLRQAHSAQRHNEQPRQQHQKQHHHQPRFTQPTPRRSEPPKTLLKPEEAKRLFATYDERWDTLAAASANIPFPARELKAVNLRVRDTLWAPDVDSLIAEWSDETVMRANTHAFFLGAVGLKPAYLETAGGKIELGVDKGSGSPAQLQQLVTILKKERTRWHSDKLGKRNGGRSGQNEALQNEERARAVYHAVCELIQAAR